MIIVPNRLGLITSPDPSTMVCRRSRSASRPPFRRCRSASSLRQFSTMMTAPSTMMPKSIAPRLIRLALTRVSTMPVIVNSIASGITQAVTIAARMFPRTRNSTAITSSAPSTRFFSTVSMVASTRRVRSYTVRATTPSGRDFLTSSSLAATRCATARLFSPISSMAVPSTVSLPSNVAAPVRRSLPSRTSATSRTRTGMPPRVPMTMSRISSAFAT